MIYKYNQRFTIAENDGFHYLMKVIAPHYKLSSKTVDSLG